MRQLRLRHDIKVKGKLSMNSIKYHLSGSLPLRLTHGRADAGLQAGHSHHGLRVHQGLDYRGQAWSLDPLVLNQPRNLGSLHQGPFNPHTDSLLSEKKHRIARNNKRSDFNNSVENFSQIAFHKIDNFLMFRNLDSVTPSPVFDTAVEMFCKF